MCIRDRVYTAEADIPQYRRAVAQTRLSLDILLGETPRRTDSAGAGLRLLTDYRPADIPVGLPSELLERRPDIMQARYDLSLIHIFWWWTTPSWSWRPRRSISPTG